MQVSVEGHRLLVTDLSSDYERNHAAQLASLLVPGSAEVVVGSEQNDFAVEMAADVLGGAALSLFEQN